ncbi:GntR family transcriptional regulator [Flavobacterium sp. ASW18X]|uniref:GntR family transcriptional regulator n=1 Tax=Flavobacterium sp. ASW18X TaxID=2572595 RepID=UPI0010AE7BF7|nr:GntR family transcriptional regulator [Flavobacterium sp. ASW18X]TKD66059.1 GntR family transcriptional regulator [Flavobacterium sp. ASW18X]
MIRNKVKRHLLKLILQGDLQVGQTINLAKTARSLGVSVTPVREALSQLEQARILASIPNRGFIVPKLSLQEIRDLYSAMADLELMAMEQSVYTAKLIQKLKEEQVLLQQSHTNGVRIQRRMQFHQLLIKACSNQILKQLITDLQARILFYERMLLTDAEMFETTDNQNEGIIRALEEDNLPTAILIAKMNWMHLLEHMEKQLIRQTKVNF